jgi:hypothetical protein
MGTTAAGIPYPEPADDLNTYPATAKIAAQKVPDIQTGTIAVVLTNAASGTVQLTFPRAFAHTPKVVFVSAAQNYFAYISSLPTTQNVTIGVKQYNDVAASLSVNLHWVAVDAAGSVL